MPDIPEHIIHWNFASDDWHCPTAENDLIIGEKHFFQKKYLYEIDGIKLNKLIL